LRLAAASAVRQLIKGPVRGLLIVKLSGIKRFQRREKRKQERKRAEFDLV
jgi:hypothetical protein